VLARPFKSSASTIAVSLAMEKGKRRFALAQSVAAALVPNVEGGIDMGVGPLD